MILFRKVRKLKKYLNTLTEYTVIIRYKNGKRWYTTRVTELSRAELIFIYGNYKLETISAGKNGIELLVTAPKRR